MLRPCLKINVPGKPLTIPCIHQVPPVSTSLTRGGGQTVSCDDLRQQVRLAKQRFDVVVELRLRETRLCGKDLHLTGSHKHLSAAMAPEVWRPRTASISEPSTGTLSPERLRIIKCLVLKLVGRLLPRDSAHHLRASRIVLLHSFRDSSNPSILHLPRCLQVMDVSLMKAASPWRASTAQICTSINYSCRKQAFQGHYRMWLTTLDSLHTAAWGSCTNLRPSNGARFRVTSGTEEAFITLPLTRRQASPGKCFQPCQYKERCPERLSPNTSTILNISKLCLR